MTGTANRRRDAAALAGLALFLAALATNLATVLNNAYGVGSTLYDSAIFQTIIWRSGWTLRPAPAVDDVSFLNVHFSPINYLPNLISYIVPIDRMTYYGLVYGIVYGALLVAVFRALRRVSAGRIAPALAGTLLFYLSGIVSGGQWEPHQEIASSLFTILFFAAWAERRSRRAILYLCLNATVREDCGLLLALPLLFLTGLDGWRARPVGRALARSDSFRYALASAALSLAAFSVKHLFFHERDIVAAFYFDGGGLSWLTWHHIAERFYDTVAYGQALWLPGLVLLGAAAWRRDAALAAGWLAFFPYWLFNFLSKGELNAQLGSYKAFPLMLSLVWPALLAMRRAAPERRGLGWAQAAVLIVGILSFENGALRLAGPAGLDALAERWLLRPESEQAAAYRTFQPRLDADRSLLGTTRASESVLALYPYSFPIWYRSSVRDAPIETAAQIDTLLWFENDRDATIVDAWRQRGRFPFEYRVVGTHLRLSSRVAIGLLGAIGPELDLVASPKPPEVTASPK